jgi:hypothetical protein
MKILIALATAAASLFINPSKAADKIDIAPAAVQSFKTTFAQASEVAWTVSNNLYKADFTLNGQFATVFYDEAGNLIATTRNISSMQLPITLQANLRNEYSSYWISDLFELTNTEGTTYYMTLQNNDTKLILKASSHKEWSLFQKSRKP